jgi:hypothetical protein
MLVYKSFKVNLCPIWEIKNETIRSSNLLVEMCEGVIDCLTHSIPFPGDSNSLATQSALGVFGTCAFHVLLCGTIVVAMPSLLVRAFVGKIGGAQGAGVTRSGHPKTANTETVQVLQKYQRNAEYREVCLTTNLLYINLSSTVIQKVENVDSTSKARVKRQMIRLDMLPEGRVRVKNIRVPDDLNDELLKKYKTFLENNVFWKSG